MLPSISSILTNADPNTQLGPQPRHPKTGVYQGMTHSAAKKGFDREQSAELADSSKGKGDDAPNHPAEEIEDEGEMIGQGDRPQVPHRNARAKPPATAPVRVKAPKPTKPSKPKKEEDEGFQPATGRGNLDNMVVKNSRGDANKERCPECGGDMRDGECESCGYREDDEDEPTGNADDSNAKAAGVSKSLQGAAEGGAVGFGKAHGTLGRAIGRAVGGVVHPWDTVKGQASLAIHHPYVAATAAAKSIAHPIKHSVDYGIEKPEEHKATPLEAGQTKGHFGGEPMFAGDTPHDQTLRAAGASMAHQPSRDHAMGALDASMAGDSKRAAVLHRKSAKEHLKEAEAHMAGGNQEQAEAHLQAAHMHHRASTHHMGCSGPARNTSANTDPQTPREAVMPNINRKEVIDFIVVNCDCAPTGGPETTRNLLKQKSTEELVGLKGKLLGIIANAKAEGSHADTKGGESTKLRAGGKGHGADDEVTYEEDEDDNLEDEPEEAEDAFTGGTNNQRRSGPMTRDEWMAAAPPEIREVVRNAEANDNREKLDLHRRITLIANQQHPHRKALILNELQGIRTKKGLQKLLGLIMPVEGITANEEENQQVFLGAGAPQSGITDNQSADDLLVPPTINWAEEHQDTMKGKARQTTTASSGR
jgi:hypothetical protein